MPKVDYTCISCKQVFSHSFVFENEQEVTQIKCPKCGSVAVRGIERTKSIIVQQEESVDDEELQTDTEKEVTLTHSRATDYGRLYNPMSFKTILGISFLFFATASFIFNIGQINGTPFVSIVLAISGLFTLFGIKEVED